jgi:hypothetical protein
MTDPGREKGDSQEYALPPINFWNKLKIEN